MKNVISLALVALMLASCGRNDRGQIVGAKGKKWHPEKPYGMALVPGGSFIMGKSDDDFAATKNAPTKTVTVQSYYMDETETTNMEYRQFIEWVRDSVTRTQLAILADDEQKTAADGGIGLYAFKDADTTDMTVWEKYMSENYAGNGPTGYEGRRLNWDEELVWDLGEIPDEFYAEVIDSMYLPMSESYMGQPMLDVEKLQYKYVKMDISAAARSKSNKRSDFVEEYNVPIYPDTTVWIRDFSYTYNEPMHNDYFWHEAYSEYPVVGISWSQAKAYCNFKTKYHNDYRKDRGRHAVNSYRLPTEAEWEYAARGGIESGKYPWGGPYAKNDQACFLANFKPLRGDYAADQSLYTVEADAYEPNDYNLFNMAGNVSEWVDSSYDANSYEYMSSMNPTVNDNDNLRKVVRGGSWKDIGYFLEVSTRDYEYADSSRSFIGFRTVQTYMGTDVTLNENN